MWERTQRSALLRAFGPGVVPATTWLLGLILVSFAACVGVGLVTLSAPDDRTVVLAFDGQLVAFLVFLCGISAFFRSRADGATVPRVLLVLTLVTASIGPWIALAIAGVVTRSGDAVLALGAPSPAFAFILAEEIARGSTNLSQEMTAAVLCSVGYALFGVGLLAMAAGRSSARQRAEQERLTQLEAILDAELRAEQGATTAPGAHEEPQPTPP